MRPLLLTVVATIATVLAAGIASSAPISIGPGLALGIDRAGVTWHEEFQAWTHADLRALDEAGATDATYRFNDGFDDSRDLVAFYSRFEDQSGEGRAFFRADLHDLALGAEVGRLDLYLAIDAAPGGQVWFPDFLDCQTDQPWEMCIAVYQSGATPGASFRIYDQNFAEPWNADYLGAYFNAELDAVEFGIRRSALIAAGWDGTSPLRFQVFTAKDGAETNCSGGGRSSDLTDAIVDADRGCSDGTLNGSILSTAGAGLVYYASIAHGNQSVNQADDIGAHIYDPPSNTGIAGGTGFLRALDTHDLFKVPLNIHPSGTLTVAAQWARRPGGASDPQDGPAFLARVRQFVDADQSQAPGSLLGGVFAEHIMPYFEGPVNARSIAITDSLNQIVYGVSAADAKVMHVPERVIRSQSTGLSPLDGHTFEDIAASPYTATVLDEVTHLHFWFHPGESCAPDAGYRHKVHRINGVYCFMINDREDQAKFGNHDGGAVMDTRVSLLQKALYGASSEIVVVFDDWEALAGKSFDAASGNSVPNNNPNQYHRTIRWLANKPWVRVANLKDVLATALANPGAFVIDHGQRFDLSLQTYEWLKHASENSYHNWYYNQNAGLAGNEQSFYDLVPVVTGPQGDYRARGATPAQDGPPLPSGKTHGDLNTPNTLLHDTWAALQAAPPGRLRTLGEWSYLAMIYETAWHEEDQLDYGDSDCYGNWNFPDTSWDGLNTWALRLQNHVRQAGLYATAAHWADSVRQGLVPSVALPYASDLDQDGELEYVIRNNRVFTVFERYGARCVFAAVWNATRQDGEAVIGAPITNPSAPGEEEFTGVAANRCSALKDMNDGLYADAPYTAELWRGPHSSSTDYGWRFVSPDGRIEKMVTLFEGSDQLIAVYRESVSGPLFVRTGLSPNPLDLFHHGHAHLRSQWLGDGYRLWNTEGGAVQLEFPPGVTFVPSPSFAGPDRRNLALTEEVELSGDGSFWFAIRLRADTAFTRPSTAAAPVAAPIALTGLAPSPVRAGTASRLTFTLPVRGTASVEVVDASGRRARRMHLGERPAGPASVTITARDDAGSPLAPGLYFLRIHAAGRSAQRNWVVLR